MRKISSGRLGGKSLTLAHRALGRAEHILGPHYPLGGYNAGKSRFAAGLMEVRRVMRNPGVSKTWLQEGPLSPEVLKIVNEKCGDADFKWFSHNPKKENTMTTEREPTFGEMRVGVSFNPSGNVNVDKIKATAAELIDIINDSTLRQWSEHTRQQELAITAIEVGCMHAVKAQTAMNGAK